jgi:hypothetical protein
MHQTSPSAIGIKRIEGLRTPFVFGIALQYHRNRSAIELLSTNHRP